MSGILVLGRLRSELHRRGVLGTLRFLARRILRFQRHLLFRFDADGARHSPRRLRGYRFLTVTPERYEVQSSLFPDQFDAIAKAGGAEYLEGVVKGEAVLVLVLYGRAPAHYGYLMLRSRTLSLLGQDRECGALVGNAFTWPEYRGFGLQTYSAYRRGATAGRLGCERVISETAPDNIASQRGLAKGGFMPAGEVAVLVVLNRVAIGLSSQADSHRLYLRWCG